MVESRWFRRAGPGIAALAALAFVASTTSGAPAIGWRPAACAGTPGSGSAGTGFGSWYRLDPRIVDGVNVGQQLSIGTSDVSKTRTLDLPSESFAAGPFAGRVLVGADDGLVSRRALFDIDAGCAWSLGQSSEVVRRATLTPDGSSIIEFRVERASRRDLGVWRRPVQSDGPESRILPPIEPDHRFGPTWLTELSWSDEGSLLAVQSCGEVACRIRWIDLRTGATGQLADPRVGDLVGLTRDRLVAHGACRGLPCPLLSTSLASGAVRTLVRAAGQAVLSRGTDGGAELLYEPDANGTSLRAIGLDGSGGRSVPIDLGGRRLLAGPAWAGGHIELPAGVLALVIDGRPALDDRRSSPFRRIDDGRQVVLPEVPR